jgi:type II secretory pathway pseudopilin PulG
MIPLRANRSAALGFTLLEVLLTLAMSVVLIVLVGGAIQFYARDMNVRDMDVRQTQLAAAVMQMIEDDLRATLRTQPVDTSALEALLASTAAGGASQGGGEQPSGEEDLSAAGLEAEDDEMMLTPTTATLDLQSGAAVLKTPGLIGNQYQIQIDLSRLPRLEEYVAMLDETTADIDDVPSDLKTVAYYVQGGGMIGGVADPLDAIGEGHLLTGGGGLVRRSLDRAASLHAASSGGLTLLTQTGELLAPEITAIEFAYWDGIMWQFEWSSDDYGELPLAVQVRLYMLDPVLAANQDPAALAAQGTSSEAMRVFTHIVRLPLARPIEETEEEPLGETGL